jgi:chromosome partitioning protein
MESIELVPEKNRLFHVKHGRIRAPSLSNTRAHCYIAPSFFRPYVAFPAETYRMARIIAVSNQKGGVGKTTSTVNIAACLAAGEKKVLVIDLDPQANAGSGLGIYPSDFDTSLYNVLVDEVPLKNAILHTELKYLDIAPSVQDLVGAEVELVNTIGREVRLKEALAPIQDHYDFILIDCPPALGILTVNALTAANSVLIPLQCEYYAMEGLSQLLKTISLIKKRLNPDLEREGILLTMYDRRNNLSHQVEQDIRAHFGDEVFQVVIPRNVKLSEAPSHGKPVILYDINSAGSTAYMEAARILVRRHSHDAVEDRKSDVTRQKSTVTKAPTQPDHGEAKQ